MSPRPNDSTERYRNDPAYRQRCIERAAKNHAANVASPTYRKLIATRKTLWQVKESISTFRRRIKALQQRVESLNRRKEELELAFGRSLLGGAS